LSSRIPIAYIDFRVFAHATEDPEKVMKAVQTLLPAEFLDVIIFEKTNLTGYHGNLITLFQIRIKDRKVAQATFEKLVTGLSTLDKELLSGEFEAHLEKGSLFLRFDKQSAYMGMLKFCQTDPIHVQVHFKKHKPEEIVEICKKAGLIP
jgi:RNA binding exosome subunit